MTSKQVLAAWGERHGVCRSCRQDDLVLQLRAFHARRAPVSSFASGRVVHVFTVWRPSGWQTPEGLALGDPPSDVSRLYGSLDRRDCTGYYTRS